MLPNGFCWLFSLGCTSFITDGRVVIHHFFRSHTRHPTGISLGSLSLNLSFPIPSPTTPFSVASTSSTALHSILSTLLPKLSHLPLSIPLLNSPTTRLVPQNKNENLESGALQLSNDTLLFIDMVGVGEGVLGDWAVRGLRALSGVITKGRLEYWFDFSAFELDCEIGVVLVSEGRSFVPVSPPFSSLLPSSPDFLLELILIEFHLCDRRVA